MEQKKILWIILSVAVFCVVLLGAGLIWFRPGNMNTADGSAGTPDAARKGFDAIEYIREGDSFPGLEEAEVPEEDDFMAVSGEIVYGEDPDSTDEPAMESEVQGEASEPVRKESTTPVETVVTAAPAAARPVSAPAVQRAPAPAEPAPAPVRVTEYWIQAGSFQSTSRAQEVKSALSDKGFSSVITTKDVGGTTWFRVRLGPYKNKAEAGKFLEWVKALDGFSQSYISEVTVLR